MGLTSTPVSQAVVDAISGKLLGACGDQDKVTHETSVDNLGDDLLVRESDDEAVFWRVALRK